MKEGWITIDIPVPVRVRYHQEPADRQAGWDKHIVVDVISYPDFETFGKTTDGAASEIKEACEADAREG